jgi:hypothetical protein
LSVRLIRAAYSLQDAGYSVLDAMLRHCANHQEVSCSAPLLDRRSVVESEQQTTNLGVMSSNLFGRASNTLICKCIINHLNLALRNFVSYRHCIATAMPTMHRVISARLMVEPSMRHCAL